MGGGFAPYSIKENSFIQVEDEDLVFVAGLQTSWGNLQQTCLFRGNTLEDTKEKFSQLNVVEIASFLKELDEFVEKFDTEGPATVGEDMDRGSLLMEVYFFILIKKYKHDYLEICRLTNGLYKVRIAIYINQSMFVCVYFCNYQAITTNNFFLLKTLVNSQILFAQLNIWVWLQW